MLSNFIPLIYSTFRINFLGTLPQTWSFSIASQVEWLNVMYEVLDEGILLPLFFILGQVVSDKKEFSNRVFVSLLLYVVSHIVLTAFILTFTDMLTSNMKQTFKLHQATVSYIRLESIAILLSSFYAYCNVILILKKREKMLYILLFIKTFLIVALDSLFVSNLSFSLNLGVNGVAWTNIIVNSSLALLLLYFLHLLGISFKYDSKCDRSWIKAWFYISFKSGLESFVRNIAFISMILALVNEVQKSGMFWITNQFIWGWLLLPILAIGKLIKQDTAESKGKLGKRFTGYLLLTTIVIITWLLTTPLWKSFIHNVMGVEQANYVAKLAFIMVFFYIIFSYNNIIDSYFYGIGRTDLMLYQSIIVNGVYYGAIFTFYKFGYFIPSIISICFIFGIGMTIDAIITWLLYFKLKNNVLIKPEVIII